MTKSFTAPPTPVLQPRLAEAERLLPYLRQIDANRVYANFGPLALELSRRLGARFSLAGENVITAASGTAALIGAILATVGRAGRERPLALVPGYSFVATAVAAEACGYEVQFADVDEKSLLLEPVQALAHPSLHRIGLVIPVGAFGRAVAQSGWRQFRDTTGVGVVIDGAACFEAASAAPSALLGEIPVAMSFHATKSFGTGEGGCVVTSNQDLAKDVVRAVNFGFFGTRECCAASINGKMSEYHAAVGLAELDGWDEKGKALKAVAENYRRGFGNVGLGGRFIGAPDTASCYALFRCETERKAQALAAHLEAEAIGHRFWYGRGMHKEPYFIQRSFVSLPNSEDVAACLIGLPVAPDLALPTIERVVKAVAAVA
jgi:dTDP-4-amino-4,6-dideoxygalactose transaminase